MLFFRDGRSDDLVVRNARVIDPSGGVDARLDVRVDGGIVTELGLDVDANGHRVIDADGLVLAPAFVDPHVHLRTPGREDEETVATGTAAAAIAPMSYETSQPIASIPLGISVGGPTRVTRAPQSTSACTFERATREWSTSPTMATWRPSSRPSSPWIV